MPDSVYSTDAERGQSRVHPLTETISIDFHASTAVCALQQVHLIRLTTLDYLSSQSRPDRHPISQLYYQKLSHKIHVHAVNSLATSTSRQFRRQCHLYHFDSNNNRHIRSHCRRAHRIYFAAGIFPGSHCPWRQCRCSNPTQCRRTTSDRSDDVAASGGRWRSERNESRSRSPPNWSEAFRSSIAAVAAAGIHVAFGIRYSSNRPTCCWSMAFRT